MIILGSLLGLGPDWWGVIFGVIGVAVSVIQAIRKRRRKAELRKS